MLRGQGFILCGVLLFHLLVWMGFIDLNGHKFFIPAAYSAGEADEHNDSGARDQVHGGPILLPDKSTTLLNRDQMRGYASYQYYCSACHGTRGGGNGTNAGNLSTRPAKHNDASYVANLSDAYLMDIIKEGGASKGLSSLMPPWGKVLSEEEVSNVIAFIRILPDAKMVMSAEEHQRSSGMGGHQHGAGAADDHHGADDADHHGATTGDHHATGVDDHPGAATEDHHGSEKEALHAAGVDDHHEAEADDHHAADTTDHHEEEQDDHHRTETDEHGAVETGEHHAD